MKTKLFYAVFIGMIFTLGLGVASAQDYETRPYMEQPESRQTEMDQPPSQGRMDQGRSNQSPMDRPRSHQGRMDRQGARMMESEQYEESTGRGYYDPVQRNPLVERRTRNGLSFINGGVGIKQRNAIEQVEDNFGLKLVFADAEGRYIADVEVDILDNNGQRVFSLDQAGPWLLTELAPGNYQVRASFDGERKTRRVQVGRDGVRTVIMHWNL